jgi:hypothetical protein
MWHWVEAVLGHMLPSEYLYEEREPAAEFKQYHIGRAEPDAA